MLEEKSTCITIDGVSRYAWYIPHHIVHNNGKARVVFNYSFHHQQTALNDNLLLGPSLGVLLIFRVHVVAISGDIRTCFTKSDSSQKTDHFSASSGMIWKETDHLMFMSSMYFRLAHLVAPAMPSTLSNVTSETIKVGMRIFWKPCSLHSKSTTALNHSTHHGRQRISSTKGEHRHVSCG